MIGRGEEILLLAAAGLTDKQIADRLSISVRTVESHWRRLREQSGMPNRAALLSHYLRQQSQSEADQLRIELDQMAARHDEAQRRVSEVETTLTTLESRHRDQSRVLHHEFQNLTAEVEQLRRRTGEPSTVEHAVHRANTVVMSVDLGAPYPVTLASSSIRQFGFAPEEFTRRTYTWTDIVHPEDFARVLAESLMAASTGPGITNREYRVVTKQGDVREVFDRSLVERNVEGSLEMTSFVFDVTAFLSRTSSAATV